MSTIFYNPWLWLGAFLLVLAVSNLLFHFGLFIERSKNIARTTTFLSVMAVLGVLFAAIGIFFFLSVPTGSDGVTCLTSPIFDLGGARSQSVMYWRSMDCAQTSRNRNIIGGICVVISLLCLIPGLYAAKTRRHRLIVTKAS